MKRKVGDKVRVREDLVFDEYYGVVNFVKGMEDMLGRNAVIESVYENRGYELVGCGALWSEEMLEDIESEQEPNYMMVWDDEEKEAEKLEVIAYLNNSSNIEEGGFYIGMCSGNSKLRYVKSIEQWKKDTGFLFENSLHERFFVGDFIYQVFKETNTKITCGIDNILKEFYVESETHSEIMTKESAEKYVKEHEVKYRPFTMEEFIKANSNWIISKDIKEGLYVVKCNSTDIYVYDGLITYESLLKQYVFEDGTPCGMRI